MVIVTNVLSKHDDLATLLEQKQVGTYVGVDPTASSLHLGHLVPFMALLWLYLHGNHVYCVVRNRLPRSIFPLTDD